MDTELTELQAHIAAALIGHTQMVKGAAPMSTAENQDCIDSAIQMAEDIEKMQAQKLSKTRLALGLLNSMVKGGEEHSSTSRKALADAWAEINKLEQG